MELSKKIREFQNNKETLLSYNQNLISDLFLLMRYIEYNFNDIYCSVSKSSVADISTSKNGIKTLIFEVSYGTASIITIALVFDFKKPILLLCIDDIVSYRERYYICSVFHSIIEKYPEIEVIGKFSSFLDVMRREENKLAART